MTTSSVPGAGRRRPRRPLPSALASTLASAVALVVLSGCGSSTPSPGVAAVGTGAAGASPSASATADRTTQLLQFASCMRQHGVNVPDPQAGATTVQLPAGTKGDAATQAALQTCQHFLGADGKGGGDPTAVARAVALAECLRAHGISVPDPQPGQPLRISGAGDPKTEQAVLACRAAGSSASAAPGSGG
ncbi:hypothetical protein [Streptacidiphilus jiangxiensis]|uniref:Uncharacterized protein n=1 Tax=Streptacidiphilus jiangxiensis TaxID=235985 RepID=A0A1H7L0I5_STRJI|nr:hypothetical protein [Streptacidiphilus jiangxiensis]SEK92498.1 hypothetical protein SAMN05414137_104287 [Streptacidiphilus jiangxiensis]